MKQAFIQVLLLGTFLWSSSAFAAITITDISGAYSNKEITATTATVYVGRTGTDCTTGSITETCSNCTGSIGTGVACSTRFVKDGSYVTFSFTSDTDAGAAQAYTSADAALTVVSASSSVTAGQTAFVTLDWTEICNRINSGSCNSGGTIKSPTLKIGTSPDNSISVTVSFQSLDTSTQNTTTCTPTTAGTGACDLSVFPGDEKIYLSLDVSDGLYPTRSGNLAFKSVRLYYLPCETETSVTDASYSFDTTPFKEIPVGVKSTGGAEYEDMVEGFQNDVYYCFRLANVDKAENIGFFTSYSTPTRHRAAPSEVVGVLTKEANCFIATAAYGSSFEPHVLVLRQFRSQFLQSHSLGRSFVKFYYKHSPPVADWIRDREWARGAVRFVLLPFWAFATLALEFSFVFALLTFMSLFILVTFMVTRLRVKSSLPVFVLKKNRLFLFFVFISAALWAQTLRAQEESLPPEEDAPPAEAPYVSPNEEPPVVIQEAPPTTEAPSKTIPLTSERKEAIQNKLQKVEKSLMTDQQQLDSDNQKIEELKTQAEMIEQKQRVRRTRISGKKDTIFELEKQMLPPAKISKKKREIQYPPKFSPQKYAASLRVGSFRPASLQNNSVNGDPVRFDDVYSSSAGTIVYTDFEWQMFQSFGKLGLKGGTGVFTAQGKGRFKNNPRLQAKEEYTFIMFPNTVGAIYRLDFWNKQFLVPFAEAGAGYYTFIELRDDYKRTKYGGSPVAYFALGGSFLLDSFAPRAIAEVDSDYGINHMWLTAEYRSVHGLDSDIDFSNDSFSAGFMVEF
ncbi:MAG: CFI-box-CTERM domain-containing protein [Bdellovibrionales bacterium]